jgi:hypothetical protein
MPAWAAASRIANGTPNPNVGRPFVSTNNAQSNRSYDADRENGPRHGLRQVRLCRRAETTRWLSALGEHTLTAFLVSESLESDSRQWQRYGIFDASFPYYNIPGYENTRFNLPAVTPVQVIYLGDSLMGRPINGAYIPSVGGDVTMQSGSMTYFDSHWNSSVDPLRPGERLLLRRSRPFDQPPQLHAVGESGQLCRLDDDSVQHRRR